MQIELEQFLQETINQDSPMTYLYELYDCDGNVRISQSVESVRLHFIEQTRRLDIGNYDTSYGNTYLMHALPVDSIMSIDKTEAEQGIVYKMTVGDHSSLTVTKIFSR